MDVFRLRERVVGTYERYVRSFLKIRDERIRRFAEEELDNGLLWPDPLLQLNPAYEPGATVPELVRQGVLREETARFFRKPDGSPIRLYKHQEEALERALRREPYLVTTGTGSGKSLTYLLPIYDALVRERREGPGVRALIVYPMNALINSQLEALRAYARQFPESPVTFDKYTGQVRDEERQRILENPPDILLTNYMMLELMLVRPSDRLLIERATGRLRFLVFDELHTYRGRQGADVAMLIRRLRERNGRSDLLVIGTSATLASEGDREQRRRAAAETGSQLFGVPVKPENVIEESLRRNATVPAPSTPEELRAALGLPLPAAGDLEAFRRHPLAAWVEATFGLAQEGGQLVRRAPVPFRAAVERLSELSGLPPDHCRQRLEAILQLGNQLRNEDGEPLFAFRLHQFLGGGSTLYATLEPPERRFFTLRAQRWAPAAEEGGRRLLVPLYFCRECGQEYYALDWDPAAAKAEPRSEDDPEPGVVRGYWAPGEALWSPVREEELPDFWFQEQRDGRRQLKREYQSELPRRLVLAPDGSETSEEAGTAGWFLRKPLLFCLHCGVAYDRRNRSDYRKLSRFSQTGRSTAATLVATAAILALREDPDARSPADAKILSFTDNRQDASLQAGHFNDFVQVALVRSALYRALTERRELRHDELTEAVFEALRLPRELYAASPAQAGPGQRRADAAFKEYLEYRLYEDLRRGWRVVQPNLEQCGLLRIGYDGLEELCRDEAIWRRPVLREAGADRRLKVIRAFLDYLRHELAIDARVLEAQEQERMRRRVRQELREPWTFEDEGGLEKSRYFIVPPDRRQEEEPLERSLGPMSALGRYLSARSTWGLDRRLGPGEYAELLEAILDVLQGQYLRVERTAHRTRAVRLMVSSLLWQLGDGSPVEADPVRTRMLRSARLERDEREANAFFAELYREIGAGFHGLEGREHTGQVVGRLRVEREEAFREGRVNALFCSPTMELGIDIRELSVVHLRNVPPTPANYAQRSGRAGRGGQPALVLTFAGEQNAHDQYFFRHAEAMVAGSVRPARLDLTNPELLEAHLHSMWLAETEIQLGHGMAQVLELEDEDLPFVADVEKRLELPRERWERLVEAARSVLPLEELRSAPWFDAGWVERTLRESPVRFRQAFERWRSLYRAARREEEEAHRQVRDPRASRKEKEQAKWRRAQAEREIELLLNQSRELAEEESGTLAADFYPYRYLASEGFLPGYNFPRLPLRALVPVGDSVQAIDRPRFLGLAEFGPRNRLYHEGRKYLMTRIVVPPEGVPADYRTAVFCRACGYFHEGQVRLDRCENCGTELDGEQAEIVDRLLRMPTVRGSRKELITSDEEERVREGYRLSLHYRFATEPDGRFRLRRAQVTSSDGRPLLELIEAPQAALWRVNNGWKRSPHGQGFALDVVTGIWQRKPDENEEPDEDEARQVEGGIRPYVDDTRNLLLIRPLPEANADEAFLASLAYALHRALQVRYQVEPQEVSVELIGQGPQRRIVFWESAEGGVGIWPRLMEEPGAVAELARSALEICHFDPETGVDHASGTDRCVAACYECLLSYSNQVYHAVLDRHLVASFLQRLAGSRTSTESQGRTREEQYRWLYDLADPESAERRFLDFLYRTGRRLPDRAQVSIPDVYAQADFYYERPGRPGVCVFVDGPQHLETLRYRHDKEAREQLVDAGYRVVVIRADQDFGEQVGRFADVFGPGERVVG